MVALNTDDLGTIRVPAALLERVRQYLEALCAVKADMIVHTIRAELLADVEQCQRENGRITGGQT